MCGIGLCAWCCKCLVGVCLASCIMVLDLSDLGMSISVLMFMFKSLSCVRH